MHLFHNMHEKYESIYVEIMIIPRVKKEANFVLKKVRRPKIIFWRSGALPELMLVHNKWLGEMAFGIQNFKFSFESVWGGGE